MTHLTLLGGKTPEELWWLTNTILPGHILLMILPRWKPAKYLSLIGPLFLSLIYSLGVLSVLLYPEAEPNPNASFSSLEGVMTIFQDKASVYIGWVHYLAFDALVIRWLVLDSVENKKASNLMHIGIVIPCIILTCLFGPLGFFLYFTLRNLIPEPEMDEKEKRF